MNKKELIATYFLLDNMPVDIDTFKKVGFRLDDRFPTYLQPIQKTCIISYQVDDGRIYEQYRMEF